MAEHVDKRIQHIAGLMARGQWRTRESKRELMAEWGVGEQSIKNYAAQASRLLRAESLEDDVVEIREATVGRLEHLSQVAEDRGQLKTAVQAEIEKAKVAGVVTSGSGTTVNVLVDATGAPKGVLADIAAALVSFAQSNQEVAGALADSLRGIGGPALRPATDTIARQIAEHAVDTVEAMPDWLNALGGQERHACEVVWWALPEGERTADVTRARLAQAVEEMRKAVAR